jgi:HSP20 family molecular chaperone IbpA
MMGISVFDCFPFGDVFNGYDDYLRPKCRTKRSEDNSLEVTIEVAGVDPDTVQLDVDEDKNSLLLSYTEPDSNKKLKWNVSVPRGYDPSNTRASIKRGLLKLHWKREPTKHKQLQITKED